MGAKGRGHFQFLPHPAIHLLDSIAAAAGPGVELEQVGLGLQSHVQGRVGIEAPPTPQLIKPCPEPATNSWAEAAEEYDVC